jgi:hypothetical protein
MLATVDLGIRSPGLFNIPTSLLHHVSPVRPPLQVAAAEFSLFIFFVAGTLSRLLDFDFMVGKLRRSLRARSCDFTSRQRLTLIRGARRRNVSQSSPTSVIVLEANGEPKPAMSYARRILVTGKLTPEWATMDRKLCFSKKILARCTILLLLIGVSFFGAATAQAEHKKAAAQNDAEAGVPKNVQQELVRIETGFFEAWKMQDSAYVREHMPEGGIFWGDSGTFSREQQLTEQQATAKVCTVEGYGLSDFGMLPLVSGAYLLTYKVEQYVSCGGVRLPVHRNGSSIYILKSGRWQAIYRAEVPLKNQS